MNEQEDKLTPAEREIKAIIDEMLQYEKTVREEHKHESMGLDGCKKYTISFEKECWKKIEEIKRKYGLIPKE